MELVLNQNSDFPVRKTKNLELNLLNIHIQAFAYA